MLASFYWSLYLLPFCNRLSNLPHNIYSLPILCPLHLFDTWIVSSAMRFIAASGRFLLRLLIAHFRTQFRRPQFGFFHCSLCLSPKDRKRCMKWALIRQPLSSFERMLKQIPSRESFPSNWPSWIRVAFSSFSREPLNCTLWYLIIFSSYTEHNI